MVQPGCNQKLVMAFGFHFEFVIKPDQTIDFALYLVRRAVLVNLPIGPGWIVGLFLETASVQFRFENTTKLINSTVGGLVSGQQLVEFSDVVRRKRA